MRLVEPSLVENAKCSRITDLDQLGISEFLFNVKEMVRLCFESSGVGLAAPQVGIFQRFFVAYRLQEQIWNLFVNASYAPTTSAEQYETDEGCLTYGHENQYKVKRFKKIIASWEELNSHEGMFIERTRILDGTLAQIFQHETDHLNGITIAMIGQKVVAT